MLLFSVVEPLVLEIGAELISRTTGHFNNYKAWHSSKKCPSKKMIVSSEVENDQKVNSHLSRSCVTLSGTFFCAKMKISRKIPFFEKNKSVFSVIFFPSYPSFFFCILTEKFWPIKINCRFSFGILSEG